MSAERVPLSAVKGKKTKPFFPGNGSQWSEKQHS